MIKAIISDFDGTLVDTFEANYAAYNEAFASQGLELTADRYRECFGLRFPEFMDAMGIHDEATAAQIRKIKGEVYPHHFDKLRPNTALIEFIRSCRNQGIHTAVASTARGKNLMNALNYIGATDAFDYILAGEDVQHGKPDPEIYNRVLAHFGVQPSEALVFEDSPVGMQAAEAAGINYINVNLMERDKGEKMKEKGEA